jgi:glucan phosphoethanolaminetransferase (alkaline phosphatase superfamily)
MITVISSIEVIIFAILAGIHFYWAFGGKSGGEYVLPTNQEGIKVLNPRAIDSVIVGVGLTFCLSIYLVHIIQYPFSLPTWYFSVGKWIVPSVFTLRAIGDFKYVGFFKSIRNTPFGKIDTKLFAPLCLFIGMLGFIYAFSI